MVFSNTQAKKFPKTTDNGQNVLNKKFKFLQAWQLRVIAKNYPKMGRMPHLPYDDANILFPSKGDRSFKKLRIFKKRYGTTILSFQIK